MSAIESNEMKNCTCTANGLTEPSRRFPKGTRSTAKCWARDTELDKQTVTH